MTNEERKKKIVKVIDNWADNAVKTKRSGASVYDPYNAAELADALIAAEIGEVEQIAKERDELKVELRDKVDYIYEQDEIIRDYKRRAQVAERALRNAAPRLKCRGGLGKGFCKVDKCDYYHCNNDDGCVKSHLEQAEKELAEEKK